MKIEKITDTQIRCTLTKDDLASRRIKLSELAYGTDKARSLFQDMMQQAHHQFGFELDSSPLMIEAIPMSPDSIVLNITKVEDPEELDTRFSKFSPSAGDTDTATASHHSGADDILDLFQKICEAKNKALASLGQQDQQNQQGQQGLQGSETLQSSQGSQSGTTAAGENATGESNKADAQAEPVNLVQAFCFQTLDDVILAAHGLCSFYSGRNSLYKQDASGNYKLILHQSDCTPELFNKICNILSEYGSSEPFSAPGEAYLIEHGNLLIQDSALQNLASL